VVRCVPFAQHGALSSHEFGSLLSGKDVVLPSIDSLYLSETHALIIILQKILFYPAYTSIPLPMLSYLRSCNLSFGNADTDDRSCSYPVPNEVGKVSANSAEFIKPVSQRKDGIEVMFAKQAAKGMQADTTSPSKQAPTGLATPAALNSTIQSIPGPSTVKDGKTVKRAIEIDASPPPSPALSQPSIKKQKLGHLHQGKVKRAMEEDVKGSPTKKKAKVSEESSDSRPEKRSQGHADDESHVRSRNFAAHSESETKGTAKASSSSPAVSPCAPLHFSRASLKPCAPEDAQIEETR
jgi:hypothetical protein